MVLPSLLKFSNFFLNKQNFISQPIYKKRLKRINNRKQEINYCLLNIRTYLEDQTPNLMKQKSNLPSLFYLFLFDDAFEQILWNNDAMEIQQAINTYLLNYKNISYGIVRMNGIVKTYKIVCKQEYCFPSEVRIKSIFKSIFSVLFSAICFFVTNMSLECKNLRKCKRFSEFKFLN